MNVDYLNKPVKVAMIVTSIKLQGAEKMATQLACAMNGEEYEIHLVIINERKKNILQDKLDLKNVQCHFYGRKERNTLIRKIHQLKWIFDILDKLNPEIIHVHIDYYFSWIYALMRKKRIVQTFHSQPFRIKNLWTLNMYKLLHRRKLITSVLLTESLAVEFSKVFHVQREELIVIPNFIEAEKFCSWRRNDNVKDEIIFAFVARFHPIKNHHMLITAFNELIKTVPHCRLLLAGDGQLLKVEKDYVRDLNIESKVDFLGEVIDMSEVLSRTDISVISSISEAFPLVLLEAMAFGLPVVVTDVGGMRDIVNGNGIKVSAGNYLEFAEAMRKLALDFELRKQYGERSLELVKQYELSNVIEKYKTIYRKELRKDK